MGTMRRYLVASSASLGVLVCASSAQALTKTVVAGPAAIVPGVFGPRAAADVDAFSQKQVTIHVGDSVAWLIHGFHTVTFNLKGAADIPFVLQDPKGTYKAITDAAAHPFWLNGQPWTVFNPTGAFPLGGKTEDGSKVTGSGLPNGGPTSGPPKPYVLKFNKAGIFKYECVVHPGMDASVKVVPAGKAIPSTKADAKSAAKTLGVEARLARTLLSFKPPANTTSVSAGNDKGRVAILKFFPETVHVPVGGTVKFTVASKTEPHTVSFGPAAYLQQIADKRVIPTPNSGGPPSLVLNPLYLLPSDPPPALPSYDGTAHGNGFFSTGILQAGRPAPPPPVSTITFTKAGTYPYRCLIHDHMEGKVIVG